MGIIIQRELSETAAALELFNMLLEEMKSMATRGASLCNIREYSYNSFFDYLYQDHFLGFRNLWKLIRNHYLTSLFPLVCDSLGIEFPDKFTHAFSVCPKEILDDFVEFLERSVVDFHLSETSTIKELANGFLHLMIWSDFTNTEIVLEAVRQTFAYKEIKASLTLICKWIRLGMVAINTKEGGCIHSKEISLQLLVQRCLSFFQFAQLGELVDSQYEIIFDQIYFSRFLICESVVYGDALTTESLMMSLLRTLESKEKLLTSESGFEVCSMLAETIWYTWIKSDSAILNPNVWARLEETMSKYKGYSVVVKPWSVNIFN